MPGNNMEFGHINNLAISVEKQGPKTIIKGNFPLRYGQYSEIKTSEYEFRFNLNGEIKFIRGLNTNWPSPAEQLKRTDGNDWIYYSVGDKSGEKGIISWMGEYYLPCLPYPSNALWEINYFSNPKIMNGFAAWPQLYAALYEGQNNNLHPRARGLINAIVKNDENVLFERAQQLIEIIGERVSVLPPDSRHVDYELIPLHIADGCLYHCKFCCVQSAKRFQPRSETEILEQIRQLKMFYGRNILNYHALFLGNHDALAAGDDLIFLAVSEAYNAFGFGETPATKPSLFLFGSVTALLNSKNRVFEKINDLPFYSYINIGFESFHPQTLTLIGKPVDETMVREAFQKMLDINTTYSNIEITGNFVIGEQLPPEHYQTLSDRLKSAPVTSHGKGAIYLSPLKDSPKKRELLPLFYKIKDQSRIPVFVYLIQRL